MQRMGGVMHILRKTLFFGAVVATMVLSGCSLDRTPQADFTMDPESGYPPLVVTFDGHASSPNDIAAYEWDFGGGDTDVGPVVSRTFREKGIYPVTLEITDSTGQGATRTKSVTALNRAPVARFTTSVAIASVNQPVRFDASTSVDPDGEIVYYLWDFGDGEIGEGVTIDHDYATGDGRRFVITLTVLDEDEATHSVSREIQVVGSPCCGG
jgi:PKD repeat protein